MHIDVIAIGNEITSGHTINSNAAYISLGLKKKGYNVYRHLSLPDDKNILLKEIKESFDVSDVVICCGGLGPTVDDLTKDTIAELFNLNLEVDPQIKQDLKSRFPNYTASERDATVFKGATPIINSVGTAPGIIYEKDNKTLILLPGVPNELRPMFDENVVSYLLKKFPVSKNYYQKNVGIFFVLETEVNTIVKKMHSKYPNLEIGIYPSSGYVKVNVSKKVNFDNATHQDVDDVINIIKLNFPKNIFDESIAVDLHKELVMKNYKVAFAESCTGGALGAAITNIPGCSKYFEASLVTYSNNMKIKLLNVNQHTLNEKGAVSIEVVDEMLTNILKISNADCALATSGIAGPDGGTDEKPVGTVCIGCAGKNMAKEIGFIHVQGKREKVIEKSVNTALAVLLRRIKYNAYTFK